MKEEARKRNPNKWPYGTKPPSRSRNFSVCEESSNLLVAAAAAAAVATTISSPIASPGILHRPRKPADLLQVINFARGGRKAKKGKQKKTWPRVKVGFSRKKATCRHRAAEGKRSGQMYRGRNRKKGASSILERVIVSLKLIGWETFFKIKKS